jgi:glycosyltransferase involved in cell wall biosynthesis
MPTAVRGTSLRQRVLARLPRRRPPARLSVVLPVYNVEDYLAEALDSILAQTFSDLEVVIVDDGSTDGSRRIADRYVERFANVRLVATDNRGLGAARNLGVRHCTGELLAFVDSDDTLPERAYTALVSALDETGSDFAVGAIQRLRGGTHLPLTPRQREVHRERRLRTTAEEFPEVLADVFAPNKVFRRSFWDRAGLSFPEGVRYEDQPTLTKAFLSAKSFDVLRAPVYFWRLRDERDSITQRRHELADLQDRLSTKRMSLEHVQRLGSAKVLDRFYADGLVMDLPRYFRELLACDDVYWETLSTGLRELWAEGPSWATVNIPVQHRLVAWLVTQGRRAESAAVLEFADRNRPLPVGERDGQAVALLPYLDDRGTGIPAELYRLSPAERADHARSTATAHEGERGTR